MKTQIIKQSCINRLILISLLYLYLVGLALASHTDTLNYSLSNINDEEKVEMEVMGFSEYTEGAYTLFLKEMGTEGNVILPIIIGGCEAVAMSRELSGVKFPRPLTYTLFTTLLDSTNIELKEVIITELKDNTFYAIIVFVQGNNRWKIDARPSDAMNLAIRTKTKIFSYRKVLDVAGEKK